MKMGFGLITAAAMLVVLAVPPAFARDRYQSQSDSEEMAITDSPSRDFVIGPPVTTPAGSIYDVPRPPVASLPAPAPVAAENATPPAANTTADGATTSSGDEASAAPTDTAPATVDGAKVDGATTPALQDGLQTAAVTVPLTPAQKKEIVGAARTAGAALFDQTHDDSPLDPTNWAVNVFKKHQELIVYYKGRLFRKYDAVFGRNLDNGAKQWAQDRRTPEGVYTIIDKYPSARFSWFLRLNYPNLVDRVRYETMRVNGVIPADDDGKPPEVGSAIGIHGTDVPILNAGHINWTTGCISVGNKDVEELERLLPVGTVVIIKP